MATEVKSDLGFKVADLEFIYHSKEKEKEEAKEDMLTCVLRHR